MRLASLLGTMLALALPGAAGAAAIPDYAITRTVPLGAPDRWDYVSYDQASGDVLIAHGDRTTLVDGGTGRTVGQAGPLDGAHGQVVVASRLYADSGKGANVSVFAWPGLRRVGVLAAKPDADAMAYDPATRRIFVMDGDSGAITVIDARRGRVVGTIALGTSLEAATADGRGDLFVNLAEARAVARIDTRTSRVTARWAVADCVSPHGIAYDAATRRVFTSCVDGHLDVLDAGDGHIVARLAIGRGSDTVAIDAGRRRVFSSNGDGTLSVITIGDGTHFAPTTTIVTEKGARTMAVDPASGRLFLVTADVDGVGPPRVPGGAPRYGFVPGTMRLLLLDPR